MNVKLILFKSTENRTDLVISEPVTILGRGRGCQIQFIDSRVSRHHCQLTLTEDRVLVRDLGSANGTHLNMTRIEAETELADGDTLIIGRYVMTVQIDASTSASPGAARQEVGDRTNGDLTRLTEELPAQSKSDTHGGVAVAAGAAGEESLGPEDTDRHEFVAMAEEIRLIQQEAMREMEDLATGGAGRPIPAEAEAPPAGPPVIEHPAVDLADDDVAPRAAEAAERLEMPPGLAGAVEAEIEPAHGVGEEPDEGQFDLRPIFDDSEDEDRIDLPPSVRRDVGDETIPDDAIRPPGHARRATRPGEAVDILDELAHERPPASGPIDWSAPTEAPDVAAAQADDAALVDILAQIEQRNIGSDAGPAAVEPPPQEPTRGESGVDVFGEAVTEAEAPPADENEEDPLATLERLAAERVWIGPAEETADAPPTPAAAEVPAVVDRPPEAAAEPIADHEQVDAAVEEFPLDEPPLTQAVEKPPVIQAPPESAIESAAPAVIPMPPVDSGHPIEAMQAPVDRPLHDAARRGERGLVSLFLSKGAKADLRAGPHGATALHYAAAAGEVLIVDLLLARGADVNAIDQLGATPLFWAKRLGRDEVARSLLQRGADPAGGEGVGPS